MDKQKELEKNFLTFIINDERYAIDLQLIQEIKDLKSISITPMVGAPLYIKGMSERLEKIFPIIDLRNFFQLPANENTLFNIIIILKITDQLLGLEVDAVSDIVKISLNAIKPAPEFFELKSRTYILEVAKWENELLLILDINRLITLTPSAAQGRFHVEKT